MSFPEGLTSGTAEQRETVKDIAHVVMWQSVLPGAVTFVTCLLGFVCCVHWGSVSVWCVCVCASLWSVCVCACACAFTVWRPVPNQLHADGSKKQM